VSFTAWKIFFPDQPRLIVYETIDAQLPAMALAFNNDYSILVGANQITPMKVFNWKTKKFEHSFNDQSMSTVSLAVSHNGELIATGDGNFSSSDKNKRYRIKIWNLKSRKLLTILDGHRESVRSIAFSKDDIHLLSGSADKTIKLWSVKTGKLIKSIDAHSETVTSVAYSHDGKYIASSSDDKTIKVWAANSLIPTKELLGHTGQVLSIAFSPDDQKLVSGSGEDKYDITQQENCIKIWDLSTKRIIQTLKGNKSWVWKISISNDGNFVASAGYDRTVRVWNLKTGKLAGIGNGHSDKVYSVIFTKDNQIVSGGEDGKLKIWKMPE
jgi:WD40 repeat protein